MIDLKQKELHDWQKENFGEHPDDIMKCALGMAEEVGEVCHHILKGSQKIREGINGIDKEEVADGVADTLIFGLQILSKLGIDAEKELASVIKKVLKRDWKNNPAGNKITIENRKDEILYQMARIARNTDAIHPSTSGPQIGSLLLKLRWIDQERYDKEVMEK